MDKKTVIKVDNLSKQYRLGNIGTGTISHDINRFFAKIRGKADPFLKIGETNDRTKKGNSDFVWALKDISFEIQEGEILGIIGKNGAGKSTLLKILSKVTGPTTGSIKAKGRIASLLEVGTGFHPELTGRENVFLNGAILGMTKFEIKSKLDEIVDFAGIERYLDTPVKRYSSGMMVRLGFAVAAHLEPEILVVDEVLAVGDADFQKKAIGKMQDVSKSGRTVLFVSHNMSSIKSLCNRGLVLNNGMVDFEGEINESIAHYLSFSKNTSTVEKIVANGIEIANLSVIAGKNNIISSGGDCTFHFELKNTTLLDYKNIRVVYDILNEKGIHLFRLINQNDTDVLSIQENGKIYVSCTIPHLPLNEGTYFLSLRVKHGNTFLVNKDNILSFSVNTADYFGIGKVDKHSGSVLIKSSWRYND
ncbi:MAG: ABC transporter ATP-binding protein [Bacteroidetes bacterium]|nr:MAG: ABC transporter ATP-binding protein [Bacteroidota bacterium]MBL1145812.1 ABC transporter ATP-binding protein [Bacteroidota bacterium]NOG58606.1 ABC transporter ATP-binding protein [Bacteroidota bacterium]